MKALLGQVLVIAMCLISGCSDHIPERHRSCGLSPARIGSFISVPSGDFHMGASAVYPEEGPERLVHVEGFRLQTHEVTNGQFAKFVGATGYQTDAELSSTSRDPGGGSAIFDMDTAGWRLVRGATWRTPSGPGSNIKGADDLPVIHVSHRDAAAYAAWSGGRLPREIEFEYAASLNLPDPTNQLSGTFDPAGRPVANTWQGFFPVRDEATDGFRGLAPVGCFPPGKLGAFDLIGNVWEWTDTAFQAGPQFTIKGGSFLCARNFCGRFRPAARQSEDADFSTNHIGFRVVKSALPSQKAAS